METYLIPLIGDVISRIISAKDEDHRPIYGIIIKDPDSNGADNRVVLEIPADQVQAA